VTVMVAIKLGLGLYPGQMLMVIFLGGKGLCLDGKYPEGRCLG